MDRMQNRELSEGRPLIREGISEELIYGQKSDDEEIVICRVNIPGNRNSMCKGPWDSKTELYRLDFWPIGIGQPGPVWCFAKHMWPCSNVNWLWSLLTLCAHSYKCLLLSTGGPQTKYMPWHAFGMRICLHCRNSLPIYWKLRRGCFWSMDHTKLGHRTGAAVVLCEDWKRQTKAFMSQKLPHAITAVWFQQWIVWEISNQFCF